MPSFLGKEKCHTEYLGIIHKVNFNRNIKKKYRQNLLHKNISRKKKRKNFLSHLGPPVSVVDFRLEKKT